MWIVFFSIVFSVGVFKDIADWEWLDLVYFVALELIPLILMVFSLSLSLSLSLSRWERYSHFLLLGGDEFSCASYVRLLRIRVTFNKRDRSRVTILHFSSTIENPMKPTTLCLLKVHLKLKSLVPHLPLPLSQLLKPNKTKNSPPFRLFYVCVCEF
jgi:hypothetical protein